MTKLLGLSTMTALLLLSACGGPIEPGPKRGAALFDTCVPCHGVTGAGNQTLGAPAIAGMPEWYVESQLTKFATGVRGSHPDDAGGLRMAPMARTLKHEGDISSVAGHVASLPATARPATLHGDPAAGKASYGVCMACHGPDGAGNKALGAPPLAGSDDWYLARQIQNFKGRIRGADPRDSTGAQMAPMAATLATEEAVQNVLAYIASLPAPKDQ